MKKDKSIRNKNRAQAALEFMMTYGWALLLLTALVGGLVYIMPHPRSLVPNKCIFGSGIPCLGTQLSSNNLTIILRNGLGQSIYNITANASAENQADCIVSNSTARAEERITLTCPNVVAGGLNVTEDTKIQVQLIYKKVSSGYDQLVIGDIYAKYTK